MASDWRIVDEPLARVVCDACGLAWRRPSVDAGSLFTSGYTLYAHQPGGTRERGRQDEYARWLTRVITAAPARVLDVGCGNGSLLRALRPLWPRAALLGCDPSPESVAHGSGDDLRLWPGTTTDLPPGLDADLVVSVNVIEHTPDPLAFLRELRQVVSPDGRLAIVCPDGGRPGVELLFADHLYSLARPHLESLVRRAGLHVVDASLAPESLGAFQMIVATPGDAARTSPPSVAQVAGRAAYLQQWRTLDERLAPRLEPPVICFGAGEAAGLLRAYAPRAWSLVTGCTIDDATEGTFGDLPMIPLDRIDAGRSVLLGVRPSDQRRLAERLRQRFSRVVAWYDLVDDG
jgi:SAM-dependent methyltransferase